LTTTAGSSDHEAYGVAADVRNGSVDWTAVGRRHVAWLLVALGLTALAGASAGRATPASGRLVQVGRFDAPVYATAPPGVRGVLYVVEQAGRIVVWQNGTVRGRPFLDIRSKVRSGGEQGLLSIAFDPAYATNHLFYVDYTDTNGDTRVVRYRSDGTAAIPSSARQLLFVKDFAANHNGGQLQFGPDGWLYWGNGDGGGGGDPQRNGQNLTRPFAKIEKLNVRAAGAHWKLVAYGLRNPWRFSFDRATGDLYVGDVGQEKWEEIDYLPRGTAKIVDFGWSRYEGNHVYDASEQLAGPGRYVRPVHEYSHAEGCAVDGGYVYHGARLRANAGRYYFGDNCSGAVWSLRIARGKAASVRREPFTVPGLSSFAEDAAGELYLMSVSSGALYRLS
jgi:glucose/arabinose dehydrogenase